jgi:hypothetical protein
MGQGVGNGFWVLYAILRGKLFVLSNATSTEVLGHTCEFLLEDRF